MGQYLSSIQSANELQKTCPLLDLSLAKIRELHGGFRSVCDNFAINLTEFESIFQSNKATFGIFDTDNNGLIDALEIFSGIIIFSDAKAEEKIRFLFDLFDFNEIQSLSLMDLEFLIQSVLVASSKMFNLGQEISDLEIAQLVRKNFQEGARITLPQLLVWCSKTPEIQLYFTKFRLDGPNMISQKVLQDSEFIIYHKFGVEEGLTYRFPPNQVGVADNKQNFVAKPAATLVSNKRALNFRAWLHTALQPLISYRLESVTMNNYLKPIDEVKMRLEWVYGIRCQDTQRCLQYTVGKAYASSTGVRNKNEKKMAEFNDEIIYFVGNTVVLLNINLSKQRFYTQHQQEIISMAVSNTSGDIVATGEYSSIKPAVHIWNSRTLDNIMVLDGIHQKGIHLLAFSSDDKYLITCGLQHPSAVLIYEWTSGAVMVSSRILSPTQDIVVLYGQKNQVNISEDAQGNPELLALLPKTPPKIVDGFVLVSLESLVVFVFDPKTNEYRQSYVQLEQASYDSTSLPICAISILADYKNTFFKQGNQMDIMGAQDDENAVLDVDHTLKHLVLTGHHDGKILIWRLQSYIGVLVDYQCEVSAMSKCFEGLAFGTKMGRIYLWDENLLRNHKIIDLNTLPFKILSSYIVTLDCNQRRLLVCTMNGDAIEIILTEVGNKKKERAQRINTIVRLTSQTAKAMTILSQTEQTIMMGGDNGVIASFDIATHELISLWNVGQPVCSIACLSLEEGGFVVAVGTEEGKIIIKQDWEEFIPRSHECGQKPIIDVKFSKNGQLIAGASLDKNVYLLRYNDGEYVAHAACKLENGFPVSLNFSEDSAKIVINTNQRKLLVFDPSNFELYYKPEDLSSQFWSTYQSRFPLITKSVSTTMMPIVLGNLSNIVIAGDENGNLFLWKDVESIKENIGSNVGCHTTNIQKIELSIDDRRVLTMGYQDQCMCQYKIKPLHYAEPLINVKKGVNEISQSYGVQKIILNPGLDETLILELNYCWQIQQRKTDQIQDQTVLVRGSNNTSVNRILGRINFQNEEKTWIRPPAISLILENIYGVLVSDKRHTLFYMHFFSKVDQDIADRVKLKQLLNASQALNLGEAAEKKLDFILPRILGNDYQNLLKQNEPITYDPLHATCQKQIVYYISRFGVMYDAIKREQSFYQGHKLKISAIAKHPFLRIVATGEVNINPFIHVWDAQTMETLVVLQTAHKGGVLHLVFSQDGQKLVSVGMDRTFSLQVFIWNQNRSIAYRNTGYYPIFGIKFNPFDDGNFITCGYQHLAEWRISGTHLTCIKFINVYGEGKGRDTENMTLEEKNAPENLVPQKNILLCLDFISYRLGHSVQSDVIFGNNLGDISTYCSSKFFILNEQAHPGAQINCIKVTNSLSIDQKTVMVVTGGEDGMIKIWDASIQIKQQIDCKQAVSIQDLKNLKSYGIQSIDIFPCDRQTVQSTATIKVLAGMRTGDVIECLIDFNRNFITPEDILTNVQLSEEQKANELQKIKYQNDYMQKYSVKFQSVFSGHSSLYLSHKQKKIISCLYPKYGILASVGNDETLMIWDVNKNQAIISKNLGTQATCLDFSPDGKFLAVGLVNGVFLLLESNIERLNFGTYMEQYTLPTLGVIMCPKESKSSIITLKFSYRGDYLAVSYNNEYKLQDVLDEAEEQDQDNPLTQIMNKGGSTGENKQAGGKRDPSFVLIFVNKLSEKNTGTTISKDPFIRLQKVQIPLQEFQSSQTLRNKLAVTKFDFSDTDRFLEMCCQIIDKDNNINIESHEDIFVVWDIKEVKLIQDFEQFKFTQWPDWSLSSSINARYINEGFNRDTDDEEKKKFMLEQCTMTNVARFTALDNAIMGSLFGEIFAFRFPALFIDKNKVLEFKYDKVLKRDMAICKGFDALTSMIQSINIFDDQKVFITGNNDQCILQYRVEYEDQDWELDFNNFLPEIPDPFGEIPQYSQFMMLCTEIWNQRLELAEIQQNIDRDEYADPVCSLELEHVIGRRGYDRRNNVKIDCQGRILYCASSLIVYLQDNQDPEAESFVLQTFLRPQNEKFTSTSPEVSCFTLSEDNRLLFIGTNHVESNLIVWEISTNLQLAKIALPQISIIYTLKVAYDNKHIVVIGVTPEYVLSIILLEYTTQTIICQKLFLHSLPYKIKDVQFIPGYTRRFVTCGIQHMCFWKFNGQSLEFTVGELTIPKAFSSIKQGVYQANKDQAGKFGLSLVCQDSEMINAVLKNQQKKAAGSMSGINALDEELENVYVTFLSLCYLSDTLVSAGDDGHLYLWEHGRIIRRIFAHEGAIFALDANQKIGFIASGGLEGIVIIWRLLIEPRSNVKSLDKLKVYNVRKNLDAQQAVMNPEYNVQSVCLGQNRVVVGMRSGTILEMQLSDDGTAVIKQNQDPKSKIRKWMKCIDHEKPISCAVDMLSHRVFTMTAAGLFTVFDLLNFDVIFQKDFHKIAQTIIAFKQQNKVLCVFDNDIMVLDANLNNGYDELKEYELKLNKISDAKLNTNEKLLGVASTSSSTPEVSLYECKDGFAKLTTFYGFKASIKYIDFSTDNYYLQCEDNLGEVQLFEIESSRLINSEAIDFELEWLGEGLRSFAPIENVRKQYSGDNNMNQICKISGKPIIAIGDEIGTIRFFNYPNDGRDGYYQCYADHLYTITKCLFTHDQRFFISTSEYDRCVFKWKVTYNDQKIKSLMSLLLQ